MGGAFNLAAPVLAVGTNAGTGISNTATATYEDPNTPDTPINATSNTVTITVAEVAGLTVVESGIDDRNGSSASTGDIIDFKFTITNKGNDTTAVYIPGKTALNANNKIVGGNIGSTAGADHVFVIAINGQTLSTPVAIPDTGLDPSNTAEYTTFINAVKAAGYSAFNGSVAAGNNIVVKVPVTVIETVATQPISVQFGNTSDATSSTDQNQQNIPDIGAGSDNNSNPDDVRTVDSTAAGDASGAPINGEREAAASQSIALATSVQTRAFATVLKTRASYIPNTAAVTDDQIRYRLDLRVESSAPAGSGFSPGTLEGTDLTNGGNTGLPANPVILVSDAIPADTVLDFSALPQAPSGGWAVVYSNTDPTTAGANAINAQWTTTAPVDQTAANAVKRVGFIYTGTLAAGSSTVNDANGFQFQVKTSNLTAATGGNILNIAQAFGETQSDTSTNPLIYDESGDQQSNNFNSDGTTPDTNGRGGFDPANDTGVASATYGSDPSNQSTNNSSSNQGQGQDGEVNLITIAPIGSILNGPVNVPGATGPGDSNQTDFVNKSITPPAGKDPAVALTDSETPNIIFNNTLNNPNTTALNNVVLKPISATQADFVGGDTPTDQTDRNIAYGENSTLPTGTTVAITYGQNTATYTWDGSSFTTQSVPIRLATLGGNSSVNYTVTVNLGAGVAQAGAAQNAAFPVAIAAFVDENGDNEFARNTGNANAESTFNLTIDRVYTGFMKLAKQARLLNADGTPVTGADGQFNTTPSFKPQPDQIIEYQISYENISTPATAGGTGSVLLNASNFNIFEDGIENLPTNGNNWAASTTHVMSKAIATSGAATVKYFEAAITTANPGNGVPEAVSNTGYVNFVGSVAPNATPGTAQGNFTFQRQVK